jgi:hypothetical protein
MGKFAKSPMQKPEKVSIAMLELESKALTRECGNGSCRSHKISLDFFNALQIFKVCVASICPTFFRTDACTTTFRSD